MSDDFNPYAPPKADTWAIPNATIAELPSASMGARFLNLVIDSGVRFAMMYAIGYAVGRYGASLQGRVWLLTIALMWIYYVGFEFFFGVTVGKLITGTRVVDRSGGRPRFGQIAGRTFSRWVPFDPLSFLGSNPDGGWHDRWSGTRVVRVR